MDPASGALLQRAVFANDANPSWLALNPARTHLYAANETATYQGANSGSVSAYSINRANGHLTLINTVSSEGAIPAHISVHPAGKHVLVANYAGGTVAVLPLAANGELGPATDVKTGQGDVGPARAAHAPPGSFAVSGHERPHVHMIESDPAGQFVFASDLGRDRIFIWKFDVQKGRLVENDPPFVALAARRWAAAFRFPSQRPLALFVAGGGLDDRRLRLRRPARAADGETDDFQPSQRIRRDQFHLGDRGHAGRKVRLCRQPAARQHRLVLDRRNGRPDVRRRAVDARRLPAELRNRSQREFPLFLQPAERRHRRFPPRQEHGRADFHRPIHAGRHAGHHRFSGLTTIDHTSTKREWLCFHWRQS